MICVYTCVIYVCVLLCMLVKFKNISKSYLIVLLYILKEFQILERTIQSLLLDQLMVLQGGELLFVSWM